MCLRIKQGETLRVAKHDIVCYKTVYYNEEKDCVVSLWRDFIYASGNKFPSKELYTEPRFEKSVGVIGCVCVYYGFHSFSNFKKAVRDLEFTTNFKYIYLKCVIPEGTPYFVGDNEDYCSESIKVVSWRTQNMRERWIKYPPNLHPKFVRGIY